MALALLRVGEQAPDFEVVSSRGETVRLRDLLGRKNVVLYFYPGDFTPVCTRETCGFRDVYDELGSQDTEVIGVSVDSDESHRRFAERHRVPFTLLSDPKRELARTYGATSFVRDLLGKTGRITYVIDKSGKIAGVFQGELRASKHVDGVRNLVRELAAGVSAAASPACSRLSE